MAKEKRRRLRAGDRFRLHDFPDGLWEVMRVNICAAYVKQLNAPYDRDQISPFSSVVIVPKTEAINVTVEARTEEIGCKVCKQVWTHTVTRGRMPTICPTCREKKSGRVAELA